MAESWCSGPGWYYPALPCTHPVPPRVHSVLPHVTTASLLHRVLTACAAGAGIGLWARVPGIILARSDKVVILAQSCLSSAARTVRLLLLAREGMDERLDSRRVNGP